MEFVLQPEEDFLAQYAGPSKVSTVTASLPQVWHPVVSCMALVDFCVHLRQ